MMRVLRLCVLGAIAAVLLAGPARAQLYPRSQGPDIPRESGKGSGLKIKRKSVSGVVKSLDPEKKRLVLEPGKARGREIPVDVGPSLIKAGKGGATFADIKTGDKITVFGEVTVQGGLRAMEITLPKERMSIPPPEKPKKHARKDKKDEKTETARTETAGGEKDEKKEEGEKTSSRSKKRK